MIRVCIDPEELIFRLDGHAGYAPEGQDIVCASASMMAAMLFEYTLRHVSCDIRECELEPGHAALDVQPTRSNHAALESVFRAVHCGFELLANRYPKHVIID